MFSKVLEIHIFKLIKTKEITFKSSSVHGFVGGLLVCSPVCFLSLFCMPVVDL